MRGGEGSGGSWAGVLGWGPGLGLELGSPGRAATPSRRLCPCLLDTPAAPPPRPRYPFTAVQWHPEKPQFEWDPTLHIPHSSEAIEAAQEVRRARPAPRAACGWPGPSVPATTPLPGRRSRRSGRAGRRHTRQPRRCTGAGLPGCNLPLAPLQPSPLAPAGRQLLRGRGAAQQPRGARPAAGVRPPHLQLAAPLHRPPVVSGGALLRRCAAGRACWWLRPGGWLLSAPAALRPCGPAHTTPSPPTPTPTPQVPRGGDRL